MTKKPGSHQGTTIPGEKPAPPVPKPGEKTVPDPSPVKKEEQPPVEQTPVVKKKEERPSVVEKTDLATTIKWAYDTAYFNGLGIGFAQGIKYIVTLAEEKLAEALKFPSRGALVQSGKLPSWWIATLVIALDYTQAPSVFPSAEMPADERTPSSRTAPNQRLSRGRRRGE